MAPSTRGIQLPRSVPHRLCSQKHSCCHTLRGDIPGAMGDTSGPHASKAQSTRVGEMQERKLPPASSLRLLPSAPGVQPGSHPRTGQLGCKHRSEGFRA